jgi:peptide-methionine (S)-S-oxide reductase
LHEFGGYEIRQGLTQDVRLPPGQSVRARAHEGDTKMTRYRRLSIHTVCACLMFIAAIGCNTVTAANTLPDPKVDETPSPTTHQETVVLSGGCFWGIQAVFEHVKGVSKATAGYSGGNVKNPTYEDVSTGATGHAESVQVIYDPSKVTFGQLLKVFFSVAHDPTELNRQGPDVGTQYRSAIFFTNPDQQHIAEAYVGQLTDAKTFSSRIVTQIEPLKAFYRAEDYHQDYAVHHPENPYIMINDLPKVDHLKKQLPDLYVSR